jgi:hypothetical protein
MLQQRCSAIPDEKIHRRPWKGAAQIIEQGRRQHDVPEPPKLRDEDATRVRDAGRFHSGLRGHSFAY